MQKNVQAAKEQKESKLPPDGVYTFQVKGADDKPSKKGDPMYALRLNIYHAEENGKKRVFKTWIGGWDWEKVQGFFDSVGGELLEKYNAEEDIEAFDLTGATGKFQIKQRKNSKSGEMEANVAWFIPLRDGEAAPEIPELEEAEPFAPVSDDDVPF